MGLNHTLHFRHSFANHYYETKHVVSIIRFIVFKAQGWQKVISVCLDTDVYLVHTKMALHGLKVCPSFKRCLNQMHAHKFFS